MGCPVTVNSVFILSLLSAATCSNTQVEMFNGNTTQIISLLAMISFTVLVSIASIASYELQGPTEHGDELFRPLRVANCNA